MERYFFTGFKDRYEKFYGERFENMGITLLRFTRPYMANFLEWLQKTPEVAFDIETVGDQFTGQIVLYSFCDGKRVFCFDGLTYPMKDLRRMLIVPGILTPGKPFWGNTTMLAHNAQYEMKWLYAHMNEGPIHIYDTMVAEQKILQGINAGLFKYDIVSTMKRRGVDIPSGMDKDVRNEFVRGYNQHTPERVLYNMSDVEKLHELKSKQMKYIKQLNLEFYVLQIQMPLTRILAQMENNGFKLNKKKFLELAKKAETTMEQLSIQLNRYVKAKLKGSPAHFNSEFIKEKTRLENRLKSTEDSLDKTIVKITDLEQKGKTHLKSYATLIDRKDQLSTTYTETKNSLVWLNNTEVGLNWSSNKQVIDLLQSVNFQPMPMGKSATTHKWQPSISSAAREKWMLENKRHEHYELFELLDEYSKHSKHVNSFGEGFLDKYLHPETNKVHTTYKQGTTATGRLASGDADGGRYNSQQIPAITALRNCFIADDIDYLIATVDLSGAELVTMCSLAKDENLRRIHQNEDMHSYFANKGWSAIYKARGQQYTEADVISKEQNKQKRTDYKPMMFGTVYGLKAPKAAETLNVTNKEGQLAIDTIVQEIPDTIRMVEKATADATTYGYVIHNTRTNSRRWFKPLMDQLNGNPHVSDSAIYKAESAARNTRIQGTQADFLLEAMVVLDRYIRRYNIDASIKLQVHDELVVQFHKDLVDWFPQRIADIMTRAANRYLNGFIEMGAEVEVAPFWTK